jgi:hypothetical protein
MNNKKTVKKLFFLMTLSFATISSHACDICGCGVGNFYFGIMPQFHKQFVGLRYRSQSFNSHVGLAPALLTSERFQSAEVWSRFYPSKRLQILSFITYHFNEQTESGVTRTLSGLGDIPILVNYNIINTTDHPLRTVNHNLWVGGGVKIPTGKYQYVEDQATVANPSFQLGSGSIDFMVNSIYTLRYKKIGMNTDLAYKINTYNSRDYKFGNRISGTTSFFYIHQLGKVGVMPNVGVYFENSAKNINLRDEVSETGGEAFFASAGLELYLKKLSLGFNYQNPFSQNLGSRRIQSHDRTMVHVTFMF